jgi:hypothetical protein
VIVASFSLDRLDEDRGDSIGISIERRLDLPQRSCLRRSRRVLIRRIMDLRIGDSGPIERREIGHLHGIGARDRERVSGAAVEPLLKMEDLVGPAVHAPRPVQLRLPVEGGLHGVLDGWGASRHEKEVRKLAGDSELPEGTNEAGVLAAVHVAVRRVGEGRRHERRSKPVVLHPRVVVADRQRGEVGVAIQVLLAGQGVHHDRPVGFLEIDHDVEAIDEDVRLKGGKDLAGRDGDAFIQDHL